MTMLARNPVNGDWALPMGLVTDPATLARQKINDSLLLWLGEWSFDTSQGMPYRQQVLGIKNPNMTNIRALFRRALLDIAWVVSVDELSVTLGTRARSLALSYRVRINTGAVIAGGVGVPFQPAQA